MSGDSHYSDQPIKFYSDCVTETKKRLIQHHMTYESTTIADTDLTDEEWIEMIALKQAISENPASVHPTKMEYFTELIVRSDSVYSNARWRKGGPLEE